VVWRDRHRRTQGRSTGRGQAGSHGRAFPEVRPRQHARRNVRLGCELSATSTVVSELPSFDQDQLAPGSVGGDELSQLTSALDQPLLLVEERDDQRERVPRLSEPARSMTLLGSVMSVPSAGHCRWQSKSRSTCRVQCWAALCSAVAKVEGFVNSVPAERDQDRSVTCRWAGKDHPWTTRSFDAGRPRAAGLQLGAGRAGVERARARTWS